MVEMAKPWKHPENGYYYIRRQIPAAIRAAFGGRQLHKVALGTRNAEEARVLFIKANAELEIAFDQARARLKATGSPLPSSRDQADDLIGAYFNGPQRLSSGLDGPSRLLLARQEIDRGLWNESRGPAGNSWRGMSSVPCSTADEWEHLADNGALFRSHRGTVRHLDGLAPGAVWRRSDELFEDGARDRQLERLAEQISRFNGTSRASLPAEIKESLTRFLDALPVGPDQNRKKRDAPSRLRPEMRLQELFEEWRSIQKPKPQSASESGSAVADFIGFVGDIPVMEISNEDLLDFRDAVAKLPATMPRADRILAFDDRLEKHGVSEDDAAAPPRLSPGSVKKRVGCIQALLTFAKRQKWTAANVGRDVPIIGYTKTSATPRRPFDEEELQKLFTSPLFVDPDLWNWKRKTTDCTVFWIFLLNCTTGSRIEEVGQATLDDVKCRRGIWYIDVDDYDAGKVVDRPADPGKSIKNPNSRRLVPIHDRLVDMGFPAYCEALRSAGHTRLFPDLVANIFGKRTHNASRRVNGVIDKVITKDARYVFHSFRHGFKDFAAEAEIQDRVLDQICGHAPTTVGGKYGQGVRLPFLHKIFHRIDWSFIDWATLAATTAAVDWRDVAEKHAARIATAESEARVSRPSIGAHQ